MNRHQNKARAFAPGSIANLAVGFDLLGHNCQTVGDCATVERIDKPEVTISAITGCVTHLPMDATVNTAGVALNSLHRALNLPFGFSVALEKGIPLGSGLGGSASSCVAALLAANALLDHPLSREALYPHALAGEAASSGSRHGDNLGSMLIGGLVMATADRLERIPVPSAWHAVIVHPHVVLETRKARQALDGHYALPEFVAQNSHLALMLAGCFKGDADLVRAGMRDVLVEPRRKHLIPGFEQVKEAALDHNALGAGIAGGGPSVFAWFETADEAHQASQDMQAGFVGAGLSSDVHVVPVDSVGAHLVELEQSCRVVA